MDYMFNKLSHELRNPLTSLHSSVQLIESQHPEVRDFKYWTSLSGDINYIRNLLDDYSSLSKSEALNYSTFSVRSLFEEVSLSFAARIADSGVEYTSRINSSVGEITADRTKLQEVLRNLLQNAFDAALPDKKIYLSALTYENALYITVRDTGCGMDEEQLKNIFEPFVTYKKHGTGLGLAITKKIVSAHSGNISVKSTLGEGTAFKIMLPLNLPSL